MASTVPVYKGLDDEDRGRLIDAVSSAYQRFAALSSPSGTGVVTESTDMPRFTELVGIRDEVYRQLNGALRSGKRHIMLYGPPGTGKTTLAQLVAGALHENYALVTGSADWASQDIIGGYQPVGEGQVAFVPGVLLKNFDRPLIIDELNRCDIDKVLGPLFTVLSGQPTSLPYRTDIADGDSESFVILPQWKPGANAHEFAPRPEWRIIATINSIDKAALYQMSFALSRRFAWVLVDVPEDFDAFLLEVLRRQDAQRDSGTGEPIPLAAIWRAVCAVRTIGPAPILDMLKTARALDAEIDFVEKPASHQVSIYLDMFYMYLLPLLDGVLAQEGEGIARAVCDALGLEIGSPDGEGLQSRLARFSI